MKNKKSYIGFLSLLTVSIIYAARPVPAPRPTHHSASQKPPAIPPNPAQLAASGKRPEIPPRPVLATKTASGERPEIHPRPEGYQQRNRSVSLPSKPVPASRERSTSVSQQLTRDDVINKELTRISKSLENGPITEKAAVEVLILRDKITRMPPQKDQQYKRVLEDWVVEAAVKLKGKKDYKELAKEMEIQLPVPLPPAPKAPVATSVVAPETIISAAPVAKPVEAVSVVSQTKRSFISSLVPRFKRQESAKTYKKEDFYMRGKRGTNSREDGQFTKDLTNDLELALKKKFSEKLSDKDVKYINDIETKLKNYLDNYINNKDYTGLITEGHQRIVNKAEEKLRPLLEKVAAKNKEKEQKEFQKQQEKMAKEQKKANILRKKTEKQAELDKIKVEKRREKRDKENEAFKKQAAERRAELVSKEVAFDSPSLPSLLSN